MLCGPKAAQGPAIGADPVRAAAKARPPQEAGRQRGAPHGAAASYSFFRRSVFCSCLEVTVMACGFRHEACD